MNSLADALKAKGFSMSETAQQEFSVAVFLAEEEKKSNQKKAKGSMLMADLRAVDNIPGFKFIAKNILDHDPDAVKEVIQIAHDLFQGKDGSKKLFWILYSVKNRLPMLSDKKKKELLARAFRRSNPTPTLVGEK